MTHLDDQLDDRLLRRLGLALVVGTIAIALVVTLYPFRFHFSTAAFARIDWRVYYRDAQGHLRIDRDLLQNLVMLVPLGVGWALLRGPRSAARLGLEALAIGIALASCIEFLQIFDRGRFPQLADVWRNAAGCGVGAVVVGLLRSSQSARAVIAG